MEVAVNGEAEPRDHKLKMFSIRHLKGFLVSLSKLEKEKNQQTGKHTPALFALQKNVVFIFFSIMLQLPRYYYLILLQS